MARKILKIIETAYRATLEEQDDPIVWLAHSLRGHGAELDVLLRGNAVNYLVRGQDPSGLRFGERAQTQPPRLAEDLAALQKKGVALFYVEEDAAARGIGAHELQVDAQPIEQAALPRLLAAYEQVWHW